MVTNSNAPPVQMKNPGTTSVTVLGITVPPGGIQTVSAAMSGWAANALFRMMVSQGDLVLIIYGVTLSPADAASWLNGISGALIQFS